jgi:hypothetical protein
MLTGELSKDMADGSGVGAGGHKRTAGEKLFTHRDYLFTDQHTQQPQKGDEGRGRGADMQQAVDNADKKTGTDRKDIHFHGLPPWQE